MKIGITAHLDDPALALLRDRLADHDVTWAMSHGQALRWRDDLATCEALFGTIPAGWIGDLTSLRWLQLESVGFEQYNGVTADIATRGIQVTNLRGQFAQPAAETAIAGTLALIRGVDQLVRSQSERRWASLEVRPTTSVLHGREVIVLGAGSIGIELRRLFTAFDCRVRSYARTSSLAELHTLDDLDAALPSADIVANCLPSTPGTTLLLDRVRLSRFTPTAIFVNVGRGSVVDQDALIAALDGGRLGGAVLDVTADEPLDRDSPLWSLPRVLLTQHTGGGYRDELIDKARRFLANLDRLQAGQPLENPVNWQAGY